MVFPCISGGSSGGSGIRIMTLEKTLLPFHHFNTTTVNKFTDKSLVLKVLAPLSNLKLHPQSSSSANFLAQSLQNSVPFKKNRDGFSSFISCCSSTDDNYPNSSFLATTTTTTTTSPTATTTMTSTSAPPLLRKRKRYRKQYPGENEGIVEEMRFIAMKLRNDKTKNNSSDKDSDSDESEEDRDSPSEEVEDKSEDEETWIPSIEGFVKYLVNSKLVFETLERVAYESDDVAYAYFRRTGLERSEGLRKDLEWFQQQYDIEIPPPSNPGVSYAEYLEDLAEKSPPLFLCHFYNIYFAHISGGQVISKQVCERLLEGRELEFNRWEGDAPELLKAVRENLNKLGEHWTRDEKNKCLREAAKSFRFLGQIVRLIIL
ncbi:hypothetical protein MKW94_006040 [Papaver nudicaule]|uniref:Inactive heme oxygenase 2, chloroplastic n=1 Tax=Papaver nudicaule TaxID=74823 RepID=A0AA41S659_PAPNU|nr:hypothetical protein [Papaver nudicaule]